MSSHTAVAHAWANQTGKNKRGFSMLYDGRTIYSWGRHFAIARICDPEETELPTILFTSRSYSSSTAKHKCFTRRAIDEHAYRTFIVDNVLARSPEEHRKNWEDMLEAARDNMAKASRARTQASFYIDAAERGVENCNGYSEAFGLNMPEVTLDSLDAAAAEIAARAESTRREAELRRAKEERNRVLLNRERLREWLNGGDVYPPHTKVPYVRVHGNQVETTWGATVPLSDALDAWKIMKLSREHHRPPVHCTMNVGDFRVSSITPTGMRVGCHFIPFKAAKLAAEIAGIETPPTPDLARWADDGGRLPQ